MLNRLSIGGRLVAGFTLLITLILALSACLLFAETVGSSALSTVIRKENNAILDHVARASINLYGAQRWRHLATDDAEDVEKSKALRETVRKDIEKLASSILDPARRARAEEMGRLVDGYADLADRLEKEKAKTGGVKSQEARTLAQALGDAITLQFEDGARVPAKVARMESGFAAAQFLEVQSGVIDRYAA
jgi:hypothetical protein